MSTRLLFVAIGIIGVILIAIAVHALTFDPFRDDVLDEQASQPLTSDKSTIVSCPTGYSQSHLDVFGENTFDSIPICASNSGIGFLRCNEEIVNSEGIVEKVECEIRSR